VHPDRPLFAPRQRETKYFSVGASNAPQGIERLEEREREVEAGSRIPRARTFSPEVQEGGAGRVTGPKGSLEGGGNGNGNEKGRNSPRRGAGTLKDAYARAVREESEELGIGGASPSPAGRTRTRTLSRDENSRAAERRRNGLMFGEIRRDSGSAEDLTVGSEASFSLGSNADDDEMDRKISQFARDEDRAKKALNNGRGLFSRGGRNRVGERVKETAQTLQRKTSGSEADNAEPGIRIPAQWGRKARTGNPWMRDILSPDSTGELTVEPPFPPAKSQEESVNWAETAADVPLPSVEGGDLQLTPPQSRPASVQPGFADEKSQLWDADLDFTARSLQMQASPQLRIRNTKLDEIRAREIESVSRHAVATSRLTEIRGRLSKDRSVSPETARAVKDAASPVTSRRPSYKSSTESFEVVGRSGSDLSERPPRRRSRRDEDPLKSTDKESTEERTRAESRELGRGRQSRSEEEQPAKRESVPVKSEEVEYNYERTILEEEGERIPGTPVTVFKNTDKPAPKEGHNREDSWDALRKLSRISASPSPVVPKHEDAMSDQSAKEIPLHIESKRHSRTSSPPKSDIDPEERIAAEASLFEIPDSKSERNSIRAPSPEEEDDLEETPRPKPNPLFMPTPVVTGAYIDTPAATERRARLPRPVSMVDETIKSIDEEQAKGSSFRDFFRSSRASARPKSEVISGSTTAKAGLSHPAVERLKPRPSSRSRPPVVNTAKPASALDDLKSIQSEASIEDSTLDNFAALFPPGSSTDRKPDHSSSKRRSKEKEDNYGNTVLLFPTLDLEKDSSKGRPLTDGEKQRRLLELQYENMNKGLKHGLESISDAKRGIERLERQVSLGLEEDKKEGRRLKENDAIHHDPHTCPTCLANLKTGNGKTYLSIPLPKLYTRDKSRILGIRFTWLGLVLAVLLAWWISESIACEAICRQEYSLTGEWDPDDPFFGWALWTLVDRALGGGLRWAGWLIRIAEKSGRVVVAGIVENVWNVWTGQAKVPSTSTGPGQGLGRDWSDGSMFEDEAI
jgi:hypothetical protein